MIEEKSGSSNCFQLIVDICKDTHVIEEKSGTVLLIVFNKQPSFTVKNPHLQLVKIDLVISVYLSVTGTTMQKNILYLWLSLQQIQTTAYINQNNLY